MEITFTLSIIAVSEIVVLLLVLLVSGLLALFGMKFKRVFKYGLFALLLPPSVFLYGRAVEINMIDVNEKEIVSERLPEEFDGYRIAHISDLHLMSFRNRHAQLEKIVRTINSLDPDAIIFSGDMVTYSPDEIAGCDTILSRLYAPDGVYSVLGNHDYCIYDNSLTDQERDEAVRQVISREEAMGMDVLMNENVILERVSSDGRDTSSIAIAGIENTSGTPHFPSHGDLDAAMSGIEGRFCILASHDPSYWEETLKRYPDTDLTLSGHTHAMQMSVFGFSPSRFLYKEYRGLYRDWDRFLYVNIGLGETAILSRVGTPPEITLLTLSAGDSGTADFLP